MKFTDTFFEFPVRIYDEKSVLNQLKQEFNVEPDAPKVEGLTFMELQFRVPFEALTDITWMETYLWKDMETAVKREDKKAGWGKNGVNVYIPSLQENYLCTLTKKEFEDKLNDFMANLEVPSPQDTYDKADHTN